MPVVILIPGGGTPRNLIPMSLSDSRFAANTPGTTSVTYGSSTTLVNLDFSQAPTYSGNGDQCFAFGGGAGTNTMSKCRVDWREGPRISIANSVINVDQCFINCVGVTGDHADGMQAFMAGPGAQLVVTNTCFRSYDDVEAATTYGTSFIGSDAFFWADTSAGSVTFNNVLIWGGARGTAIYPDNGVTVHINFNNVYYAPSSSNSFEFFTYDIRSGTPPGTLIVDNWTNVFAATVVNGVIVPGAALPSP